MKKTGQRTPSVFQRVALVEEGMLEAGEGLAGGLATDSGKDKTESGKVIEMKP